MFEKENREGEPFVADVTKAIKNGSLTALEGTILADIEAQIHQGKKVGIREMAARNFTSTTTIIRLAKKLGYQGFTDMYYAADEGSGKRPPGTVGGSSVPGTLYREYAGRARTTMRSYIFGRNVVPVQRHCVYLQAWDFPVSRQTISAKNCWCKA